jgi:peptidyl-prolyl cis-trans isomerase B (cyclophilin B)
VASKKQRQRQIAKDAYERRLERQADRERRAKQWAVSAIVAVLVVGIGVGSAWAAGAFKSPAKAKPLASASQTPSTTPSTTPSASPSPSASASPTPTTALVNGKCVYTASGTAARKVTLPPLKPDTKATYQATMATNRGNIVINLLNFAAPCTVNSFVSLADQKYFNATHCHRLTTSGIFVLQCGDPLGTGEGGPGYVFPNENLNGLKLSDCPGSTTEKCATFPPGTIAMANTGSNDTNGSQFFLVYKTTVLPDGYTPFGTIVSGLNILQNVAKAGSDNANGAGDGHPKEAVDISSVTIKKT